jgi:cephalosporin hydroxylase
MKLLIDSDKRTLTVLAERECVLDLYSREAFEILSKEWVRVGWNQKYPYTFSWLGRPIIQLPEDIVRVQEAIYEVQPDVIVETGIAHGGSLVLYAGLFRALGKGRVIGVDIEIRPHNRKAIESHILAPLITLVEGSSIDPAVVARVKAMIEPTQSVMVLLDSNHTRDHVRAELEAYCGLVTQGSYIVATDGIMQDLADVPRGNPGWKYDNPATAAREFADAHPEFVLGTPRLLFNESELDQPVTHWRGAWLRRR